jgi:hypothetical protein
MTTEQFRQFITERPALSLPRLEREAGLPFKTLSNVKSGRQLSEKHIPKLLSILPRYGLQLCCKNKIPAKK